MSNVKNLILVLQKPKIKYIDHCRVGVVMICFHLFIKDNVIVVVTQTKLGVKVFKSKQLKQRLIPKHISVLLFLKLRGMGNYGTLSVTLYFKSKIHHNVYKNMYSLLYQF